MFIVEFRSERHVFALKRSDCSFIITFVLESINDLNENRDSTDVDLI